jgi:hypothetical protein
MNTTVVKEPSVSPKWLIEDHQWKEISKHSLLRQEDRHALDLLAIMSRYVLRSPQLNEKEYKNFRADVKKAVEQEKSALDTLRRLIANDALFSAIASEWNLLQIVFGIFEDTMGTSKQLQHNLQMELLNKERLLAIYNIIKIRLGGAGRMGNDALAVSKLPILYSERKNSLSNKC